MSDLAPRWLHPESAASYIGRRVDELPRLVKRGLIPEPSYHFGPRSPRYDRVKLDALFTDAPASRSVDRAIEEAADAIRGRARGQTPFGGRQRQGVPLRQKQGA